MYSESVCLKELIESGSESNFSSQYPMRKALDIHCNKLSSNIFWSLSQGRKGMLYDVCFDLFREKQPKFFKFFKNFLFNFLNFQTKINFEKKNSQVKEKYH